MIGALWAAGCVNNPPENADRGAIGSAQNLESDGTQDPTDGPIPDSDTDSTPADETESTPDPLLQALLADIAGAYHPTDSTLTGFNFLISAEGRFLSEVLDSDAYGMQCGTVELCDGNLCIRPPAGEICPFFHPHVDCIRTLVVTKIDDESIDVRANKHSSVWIRGRECPDLFLSTDGIFVNETVEPCDEQWVDESQWCDVF